MQNAIDINSVKRKVQASYFQDGLWDILLGFFWVVIGLVVTFDINVYISPLIFTGLFITILSLKRWLTNPRMGLIRTAAARKIQIRIYLMGLGLAVLTLVFKYIFTDVNRPEWLNEYYRLIFVIIVTLMIAVLGYWWRVTRWYIYAGLILVSFFAYQWLNLPRGLCLIAPGGLIALYGTALLILFLRRYPKPTQEEKDAVSKA
ncbi:hypothetical protein ACFLTB_04410 [Chloroflexota bacterium]